MANVKSASLQLSILAFASLIAACNGSSVTDRTSNPTKPYQSAIDHSQPWRPGMKKAAAPKDADNTQYYCGNDVFHLSVSGQPSLRRLTFHADVESAFELKVVTQSNTAYTVSKVGGPKALQLRSLGDPSRWQLVWKPSRQDLAQDSVKIVITDEALRQTCQFSYADIINLVVDPGPGAPVLTIGSELPTSPVEFTDTPIKFSVVLVDPAGTVDKAPVISEVGADERMISNPESRQLNVSAKTAVTCDNGSPRDPGTRTWTFQCEFRMSQLPNVANLAKTAQIINAVFFVKGKSLATALDAPQASASVQVHFPGLPKDDKTIVAKDAVTKVQGAPAASDDVAPKPVKKATTTKPKKINHQSAATKKKQQAAAAAKAGATT